MGISSHRRLESHPGAFWRIGVNQYRSGNRYESFQAVLFSHWAVFCVPGRLESLQIYLEHMRDMAAAMRIQKFITSFQQDEGGGF